MPIVSGNAGNFLCPPGHPQHFWCFESTSVNCSLESIIKNPDHFLAYTVERAKELLDAYDPSTISPTAKTVWILEVERYFADCWSMDGIHYNASSPMLYPSYKPAVHLAYSVHWIRRWIPDYVPDWYTEGYTSVKRISKWTETPPNG